jgi:hypothetical protein
MKTVFDEQLERDLLNAKIEELNRSIVLLMALRDEALDLYSQKFENL